MGFGAGFKREIEDLRDLLDLVSITDQEKDVSFF